MSSAHAIHRSFIGPRHPHLPPTLPEHPLVQVVRYATDLGGLLADAHTRLGATFTLDLLGFDSIVVFTEDEPVAQILGGDPADFHQANDIAAFFIGDRSLVLLDGEAHKHARRRTLTAFTGKRMLGYGPIVLDAVDRYVDTLREGDRIGARDAGHEMALDVILRALLGMAPGPAYDLLRDRVRSFMKTGHDPIASLLTYWLPGRKLRSYVGGKRDPETLAYLPRQGLAALFGLVPGLRDGRALHDALLAHIRARRECLDDGRPDALGHILRTARDEGHAFADADAIDETLTLVLAGHDTTAVALSRVLLRLAMSPHVVDALRAELDGAFGDGPIDTSSIDRLPYLEAVLNETFRLDAPVRGVTRRLARNMTIGGLSLEKGQQVTAYLYPRYRDGARWPNPDTFDPAQFVGKRPKAQDFSPFGGGYRRCVGATFATYELKIMVAEIARRVDLAAPTRARMEEGMLGPLIALRDSVPLDVIRVRPAPSSG